MKGLPITFVNLKNKLVYFDVVFSENKILE